MVNHFLYNNWIDNNTPGDYLEFASFVSMVINSKQNVEDKILVHCKYVFLPMYYKWNIYDLSNYILSYLHRLRIFLRCIFCLLSRSAVHSLFTSFNLTFNIIYHILQLINLSSLVFTL